MGLITRAAGTGAPGNTGDDGLATGAQLNEPVGVAATTGGAFLIADAGNHEVRKVSAAGVITRVAGTGTRAIPATTARRPTPSSAGPSGSRRPPTAGS